MTSMECVFCRIVARALPAPIVREDEKTLAFMDAAPATEGHVLVVPKRHARNLFDIDPEDLRSVAVAAQAVAWKQRERLRCAGVTLYQANEPAGFQDVFHYHLHVVPRYPGDRVLNAWRDPERPPYDELQRVAARLRD